MKKVNDSVKYYCAMVAFNLGLLLVGSMIAAMLYYGFVKFVQHDTKIEQIEFSEE
jgi:hypothetical protein